jgi:RNA polymerase sigma-70 factor (ECF subfamily)
MELTVAMVSSNNGFDKEFRKIYEKYFTLIFRIALRITGDTYKAEDICHEAFIKLYKRAQLFEDLDQAKYWLIRVVKNLSYNHEKKMQREKKAFERLHKSSTTPFGPEEQDYIKQETEKIVQEALSKIPYNFRVVLILKEYGGLTYKEIGSIIGISEANVKIRVYRGRERLEKYIKEQNEYVP